MKNENKSHIWEQNFLNTVTEEGLGFKNIKGALVNLLRIYYKMTKVFFVFLKIYFLIEG